MAGVDYRKLARRYEGEARELEEMSSVSRKGPTHREIAEVYEKAGDAWKKVGTPKARQYAVDNYQKAMKFAYDSEIEGELDKKMKDLPRKKEGFLERISKMSVFVSIASFVVALGFVSFSLTGYAVGGLNVGVARWIGIFAFIIGLIFAYFYFHNKRKIEK